MKLSIIVLNYQTKNLVKQCLKNIVNLNLPFKYEIIVVDNDSRDGIEKMIDEEFPDVRFIQSDKNNGMGGGNNLGIKAAWGEYVLILNPDVVVLENSLEKMVEFLDGHSQTGTVAPKLLNPNRTYQQSRYQFPDFFLLPAFIRTGLKKISQGKLDEYFMNNVPGDSAHKIDWARGSALMVRRYVLEQINGFDQNFFMYMEDTDLCRRVWRLGFEIWYLPEAQLIHYYARESADSGQWLKDLTKKITWIHIFYWLKYFWKWRGKK